MMIEKTIIKCASDKRDYLEIEEVIDQGEHMLNLEITRISTNSMGDGTPMINLNVKKAKKLRKILKEFIENNKGEVTE